MPTSRYGAVGRVPSRGGPPLRALPPLGALPPGEGTGPTAESRVPSDMEYMKAALALARRGYGQTSPNPMVGAVLVRGNEVIGRGWHHQAGKPHAEIEAFSDATRRGHTARGATLYVTLEPCSTTGRTLPCTEAIKASGVRRVVVGAVDPNPAHAGRAFKILKKAGIEVHKGVLADECTALNEPFNHWIVNQTPLVTVKAAMTLDGRIATASGQSKWITSERSRRFAMKLRQGSDAILVGVNTVIADNPALLPRGKKTARLPLRIVLDPRARIPLDAQLLTDAAVSRTIVVVGGEAAHSRCEAIRKRATLWQAPGCGDGIDLRWVLNKLGAVQVLSLLVEGGGVANAAFLMQSLAHRIAFFYAPMILGGREARRGVAGPGVAGMEEALRLTGQQWQRLGPDLLLEARVIAPA